MPVRSLWIPLLVALPSLGVAAVLVGPRAEREPSAKTTILDRRLADFREDEDPARIIAALEAVFARDHGHSTLTIHVSAIGPRIVPPPGAEALSGSNTIAAREIASILAEGRAEVRIEGPAGARPEGPAPRGRVSAGRRTEILERRLLADGRVEHVPAGGIAHVVEAVFEAPLEGDGRFTVEVVVDGHVRARATCVVDGDRGRVTSLEGVAEHGSAGGRP